MTAYRPRAYQRAATAGRRIRRRRWRAAAALVGSAAILAGMLSMVGSAEAATLGFREGSGSYIGTQDTFLDEASQGTDHGSDIRIGMEMSDDEQGLLRFDGVFGPGADQIPLGATITAASLEVWVTNTGGGNISFHRMIQGWTESDTWTSMGSGIQTDGSEAVASADLVFAGTGISGSVTINGLEASLQAWSDGDPNLGWAMLHDSTDGWDIASSEVATVAERPRLVVEYSVGNGAPAADSGGPYGIAEGEALVLDATGSSDPDGDPLSYAWDLDNDGSYDDATGDSPTVPWATLAALGVDDDGIHPMGLRVSDGALFDTDTFALAMANTRPALAPTGAPTAHQGVPYTLSLVATDPGDDAILEWYIDWGDGTTETIPGSPPTASHTYSLPGFTRNIVVAARDDDGMHNAADLLVPSYLSDETIRYAADDPATSTSLEAGHGIEEPYSVAVGPDGDFYVGAEESNQVIRYDGGDGSFVSEFAVSDAIGITFGPDGHLYVAGFDSDEVLRYDRTTGAPLGAFVTAGDGGIDQPIGLVFGPDGHLYVSSFSQGAIYRYHGITGAFLDVFVGSGSNGLATPEDLAFGPDGHLYVSDPSNNNVQRYRGDTGASLGVFNTDSTVSGAIGIAFAPDGLFYVGAYWEDRVLRLDASSGDFVDEYIAPGQGGLTGPSYHRFVPQQQVEVLPAPMIVNSTDDDGDLDLVDGVCDTGQLNADGDPECTLRAAIEQSNALPNADTIQFDIPTSDGGYSAVPGSWLFTPLTPYDYIVAPVSMDATTQPGFVGRPVIELDGAGASGSSGGLILRTDDSLIQGFAVHSFDDEGLEIDGSTGFGDDNSLIGNWVGFDAVQNLHGNTDSGILVTVGAARNTVDGNVVGGSGTAGITIRNVGTDDNEVTSNYIGLAPDGVTPAGNPVGIAVIDGAADNRIGLAGSGNVVSANTDYGIDIRGAGTTGTLVTGNLIGIDAGGTQAFGNRTDGIAIRAGATGTIVGGVAVGDRNYISGNGNDGVWVTGVGTDGNTVRGNWIGYGTDGSDLGNSFHGVAVENGADGNLVEGNRIGNNLWDGIAVANGAGAENAVVANAVFANVGLGIDLENDGVTGNDSPDADGLVNYPVITGVSQAGPSVQVNFDLEVPAGFYRIDLFENTDADPTRYGEGETPVGFAVVDHPGGGPVGFAATYPGTTGSIITATTTPCTDGTISCVTFGGTSEFSLAYGPAVHLVNSTDDDPDADTGDDVCDTGQSNSDGDPECTLRAAIEQANATFSSDTIRFAVPGGETGYRALGSGVSYWSIQPATALPSLSGGSITIDGSQQEAFAVARGLDANDGGPEIEIDGALLADGTDGLVLASPDNVIRHLVVGGFDGAYASGVLIQGGSATGNRVLGSYLGTNAAGDASNPNYYNVRVAPGADGNVIGGPAAGEGNLIAGSDDAAVLIAGGDGNTVTGNLIGTDRSGTAAIQTYYGVEVSSSAVNTVVGGPAPADGNLISGIRFQGVFVEGDATIIRNNRIGTKADGLSALGNMRGIWLQGSVGSIVADNLVSGNTFRGIVIANGADDTVVQRNLIGTDARGTGSIPNAGSGIEINFTSGGNLVGGLDPVDGNLIANNLGPGIVVVDAPSTGNTIVGNTFRDNTGLAIDLGDDGHTGNDDLDTDSGANDLLNHPVIRTVTHAGVILTANGTFDVPAGRYRFDFFTNPAGDPSGFGEAGTYVGTSILTHTGSGPEPFGAAFVGAATDVVTATVTECDDAFCTNPGSTSEMSNWEPVREPVVLDRVYHGTSTISDGALSVADGIGASVDNSKAILTFGVESAGNAPADNEVMGIYSGPGTLTFSRVGTSGEVTVHWSVAVFSSGVDVRRGTILMNGLAQVDMGITAVDPSRSFVITSHKVGGTDYDGSSFLSAQLLDPATLRLSFDENRNDQSVMWQVVEYSEAAVQSGTLTLADGDLSRTVNSITAVDPAKSWLTYSYESTTGTVADIGQKAVDGFVTDPTTLLFARNRTGSTVDISWRLVEFTDAAEVQHAGESFAGEASRSVGISRVSVPRAFAVGGYRTSGGSTPYSADDVPGVARFSAELTSATELTLSRGSTASSARAGWFVIHWPGVNSPPVFDQDLGNRVDAEGSLISVSSGATDPDGDSLVYTATGLPPGIYIDPSTGLTSGIVSYEAAAGSPYAVEIRVDDPDALFDTDTFTWTITDTPVALEITKDSDAGGVVDPGQTIEYTIAVTNTSGVTQTLVGVDDPLPAGTSYVPASTQVDLPAYAADSFDTGGYSGDDGTLSWAGPWAELGDGGDPAASRVVVTPSASCVAGECLRIGGDDVSITGLGVERSADLAGFGAATLEFYRRVVDIDDGGGSVRVEVMGNGLPWTQEASFSLLGTNPTPVFESIDITPYLAADTAVRFVGSGTTSAYFYADQVAIRTDGSTTIAGGAPATLVSGIDLPAGDVLTITFEVTVDDPVAVGQIANTATVTSLLGPAGSQATHVDDVNRPPVFDQDLGDRLDPEGAAITLSAAATDPDGNPVAYSATGLPPNLSIDPGSGLISGSITYAAAAGSPYAISVRAEDPRGLFDTDTFTWTITDTNRAPVVVSPGDQSDAEGDAISLVISGSDPDLDGLTWSASGLPDGLSIDPGSGEISGSIGFNAAAGSPFGVTVRATDDGTPALFDEVAFTWTVADTNRAPVVVSPGDQSDAEGDVVSLPAAGTDPDGDGLVWSASGLPDGLSIDPVSGSITGSIGFDAAGGSPFAVTVRATDTGVPSLFDEVAFAWSVTDTNRAPVVVLPGDQSDAEGDVITLPISGSDPDLDGLTWSAGGLPGGLWIDPSSGQINGTIGFGAAGLYPVTVRATDDGTPSLFDEVAFTWTVSDTNRSPVVVSPGDQSDAEGDSISLVVAGTDPDLDGLTWSASGLPDGLSIDPGTGEISGTVGFDAAAGSPFGVTVRATDDGTPSLFDEVAFTWTVTDTNRSPVVVSPGDQSDAEGVAVSLVVAGSDPDLDGLTWSATGLPDGLSIDPGTGEISGLIGFDAAAVSPFGVTVRATDDGTPVLFDEVAFSWTVSDTNRAPVVVSPGDQSDAEGDSISLVVAGSDPDLDGLTWSASGLPDGLSIDPGTGEISGSLSFVSAGPHAVVVRATDDGTPSLFDEVGFSWTVSDTNRKPVVVSPGDQSDAEGDAITLPISGSDPDLDGLTWSATGLPDGLSIDPGTGEISGVLTFTSAGPHAVVVRATDDGTPNLFDEVSFSWTVSDTNRAPMALAPADQSDAEGDPISLIVAGSDPDLDTLTWSAAGLPDGLSIDPGTGEISGSIGFDAAAASPFAVTVRATDDGTPALFDEVAFTWTVTDTNRAPVVVPPVDQSDAEGDAITLPIAGSDPDLDTLTWSATGLPDGLSIDLASGEITGSIGFDAAAASPFAVTVRATDDGIPALFDEVSFSWTVSDTNRAPAIVSPGDRASGETDAILLAIPASDPDFDTLTWSATGLPDGLSIDPGSGLITGTVSFDAAAGSPFAVTVTVTDDGVPALDDQIAFSWMITNLNRAPTIAPIADQTSSEGAAVALALIGNDPDGNGVTWSASGLPDGLSIDAAGGEITGIIGFEAADGSPFTVMVTATDDGSPVLWTTATFSWSVADVNRPPVIDALPDRSDSEGDSPELVASATDPDSDGLSFSAGGLPDGISIDPDTGTIDGTLAYTAAASSPFEVTVTVTDDGEPNLTDQTVFSWTVADVNRSPIVASPGDQASDEGAPVALALSISDPDGDQLLVTAGGLPSGLSLSGSWSIAGTPTVPGTYSVWVSATDDGVPSRSDMTSFRWVVRTDDRFGPALEPIPDRSDVAGEPVVVTPIATHPGAESLEWSAEGLPDGIELDTATGVMSGTPIEVGETTVEILVVDETGRAAGGSFTWTIVEAPPVNLPPVARDDAIDITEDDLVDGSLAIDVLSNDTDPEGAELSILLVFSVEVGEVTVEAGHLVFTPDAAWEGTSTFGYAVSDPAGNRSSATVTVTLTRDTFTQVGGNTLTFTAPAVAPPGTELVSLTPGSVTGMAFAGVAHSLHVLRLPLALLGGAVIWSMLFGGLFSVGFAFRSGAPTLFRRSRRRMAVVLAPHGAKVPVHREPGEGELITRLSAVATGIRTTGKTDEAGGIEWTEILHEEERGWVESRHLTIEVDTETFAADPAPADVLSRFAESVGGGGDLASLISRHGLWVVHHDDPVHYPPDRIEGLLTDRQQQVWSGRNPAYPDRLGAFGDVVAAEFLESWGHPQREIQPDQAFLPSTRTPVEFVNFHALAVGARLSGRERLDQVAWQVCFSYEKGGPRIVALIKEG